MVFVSNYELFIYELICNNIFDYLINEIKYSLESSNEQYNTNHKFKNINDINDINIVYTLDQLKDIDIEDMHDKPNKFTIISSIWNNKIVKNKSKIINIYYEYNIDINRDDEQYMIDKWNSVIKLITVKKLKMNEIINILV